MHPRVAGHRAVRDDFPDEMAILRVGTMAHPCANVPQPAIHGRLTTQNRHFIRLLSWGPKVKS